MGRGTRVAVLKDDGYEQGMNVDGITQTTKLRGRPNRKHGSQGAVGYRTGSRKSVGVA
jgi:hypothetical protein